MIETLVDVIVKNLGKTKYKFMNVTDISKILKQGLGENYKTEIFVQVKNALMDSDKVDFYPEGTYINDGRYYHSTGYWIAIKGVYDNPVQAKFKRGWYAWQDSDEVDFAN